MISSQRKQHRSTFCLIDVCCLSHSSQDFLLLSFSTQHHPPIDNHTLGNKYHLKLFAFAGPLMAISSTSYTTLRTQPEWRQSVMRILICCVSISHVLAEGSLSSPPPHNIHLRLEKSNLQRDGCTAHMDISNSHTESQVKISNKIQPIQQEPLPASIDPLIHQTRTNPPTQSLPNHRILEPLIPSGSPRLSFFYSQARTALLSYFFPLI